MQPIVVNSLVGFVFAAGGVLLVAFGLRFASATEDASRLREYVLEETVGPAAYAPRLAFRQAELAGSVRTRLFAPLFRRLGRIFGSLTPRRLVDDLQRQLAMAGSPLGLGPREFYGLRMISILVGLGVAWALGLITDAGNGVLLGQHALSYSVLAFLGIWLSRRILWFGPGLQALHIGAMLLAAQAVAVLVRIVAGDTFPGWALLVGPLAGAVLWPLVTWLLLRPQRRAEREQTI